MNSLASKSPIVEGMVVKILDTFPVKIDTREKHVLNAELIPQIHEKIIEREELEESIVHTQEPLHVEEVTSEIQQSPVIENQPMVSVKIVSNKKITPSKFTEPPKPSEKPWETFKKILPMLQDPFVSYIECKAPNQPLSVIKNGKTQITKTIMDRAEIDEYLKYLSERTRVPLVEGVFNVRVDDYNINAIISNSLEPSFIIKKNLSGILAYPR